MTVTQELIICDDCLLAANQGVQEALDNGIPAEVVEKVNSIRSNTKEKRGNGLSR